MGYLWMIEQAVIQGVLTERLAAVAAALHTADMSSGK